MGCQLIRLSATHKAISRINDFQFISICISHSVAFPLSNETVTGTCKISKRFSPEKQHRILPPANGCISNGTRYGCKARWTWIELGYPVMLSHILERRRFNSLRASYLGDKRSRDRYNVELILRCIGLCFSYHLYLLSRSDQQLIQRIPAGLSSTVVALF